MERIENTEQIDFNLAIEELGGNRYRVVMPDEKTLEVSPMPKKGFAIRWPVNPHFTGAASIRCILQADDNFKNAVFV